MKSILHYINLTIIISGLIGTSIYAMYESVVPLAIMFFVSLLLATLSADFFEDSNNSINQFLGKIFDKIYQ